MALTGGFMGVEVVAGLLSGSLALLADAGHMLTDAASLGLAWLAGRLAVRPADQRRSYGYHRLRILAAFVNGISLLAIAVWISVEAVRRLISPQPVEGEAVMIVAVAGLIVNLVALRLLGGHSHGDLNIRGAALHVMGDLLGSVAALAAGAIIWLTGWLPADPLLSLLVCGVLVHGGLRVVRATAHVLLEGSPDAIAPEAIRQALTGAVPALIGVHHVHSWMLTPDRPLITLHAQVREGADHDRVLADIHAELARRFKVDHATVQLEYAGCAELHAH